MAWMPVSIMRHHIDISTDKGNHHQSMDVLMWCLVVPLLITQCDKMEDATSCTYADTVAVASEISTLGNII